MRAPSFDRYRLTPQLDRGEAPLEPLDARSEVAAQVARNAAELGEQLNAALARQQERARARVVRAKLAEAESEYEIQLDERMRDTSKYATLETDADELRRTVAAKVFAGLDDTTRATLDAEYELLGQAQRVSVKRAAFAQAQKVAVASLNDELAILVQRMGRGDDMERAAMQIRTSLAEAAQDGVIDPGKRADFEARALDEGYRAFATHALLDAPSQLREALQDPRAFAGMSEQLRADLTLRATARVEGLQNAARIEHARMEAAATRKLTQARGRVIGDLTVAIMESDETALPLLRQHVESLWAEEQIAASTYTSLVGRINARSEAATKEAGSLVLGQALYESGMGFDRDNSEHRHAQDAHFARVILPSLADQEPEAAAARLSQYLEAAKSIPADLQTSATQTLRAGNVESTQRMARMLQKAMETVPWVVNDLPADITALVNKINAGTSAGGDPVAVIENARNMVYRADTAKRKERMELITSAAAKRENEHYLGKLLAGRGWMSAGARVPFDAQADFESLLEVYAEHSDDPAAVRDMAGRAMLSVWGTDTITGTTRVMRYPPAMVLRSQEVAQDLWQKVKQKWDPRVKAIDGTDLSFEPLPDTGDSGRYALFFTDSNGMRQPLTDNGVALGWRPTIDDSAVAEESRRANEEAMRNAKESREKYRQGLEFWERQQRLLEERNRTRQTMRNIDQDLRNRP